VYIFYHCEGYHNEQGTIGVEAMRVGFEAFKVGDRFIALKENRVGEASNTKLTIVGFEDGLPHKCFKCRGFAVAKAFISLKNQPSGPYPDLRIREMPIDNPGVVLSPKHIASGMYTEEFIQLIAIGGHPPFRWQVENIEPYANDTELYFQIQEAHHLKRDARLVPDKDVLGLAKVTIIDKNGHKAPCYVRTPGCFQDPQTGVIGPVSRITTSTAPLGCQEQRALTLDPEFKDVTWKMLTGGNDPNREGYIGLLPTAEHCVVGPSCSVDPSEWVSPICIGAYCRAGRTGEVKFDEICIPFDDPGANPECMDPVNIEASETQMECGSSQTLSSSDGNIYKWRISGDNGSMGSFDETVGSTVEFTAASTNPNCENNATVELVCTDSKGIEHVVDTISIAFNCYNGNELAYNQKRFLVIWYDSPCTDYKPPGAPPPKYWPTPYARIDSFMYKCDGSYYPILNADSRFCR
ncbi:MAG: hypothetical protein GY869_29595, partial [Planctomycetes bacterium]|nr:hypothetical protein [Planctomycetota bacterium]